MTTFGDPIKFCGGSYIGETGWIDPDEGKSKSKRVAVIVDLGGGKYKHTKVDRKSIRRAVEKPANFAEACFFEADDICELMEKLCVKLSECDLQKEDVADAEKYFGKRLKEANKEQARKGSKARFRRIKFRRSVKRERDDSNAMRS